MEKKISGTFFGKICHHQPIKADKMPSSPKDANTHMAKRFVITPDNFSMDGAGSDLEIGVLSKKHAIKRGFGKTYPSHFKSRSKSYKYREGA